MGYAKLMSDLFRLKCPQIQIIGIQKSLKEGGGGEQGEYLFIFCFLLKSLNPLLCY